MLSQDELRLVFADLPLLLQVNSQLLEVGFVLSADAGLIGSSTGPPSMPEGHTAYFAVQGLIKGPENTRTN